jgi:hypothetical protein
VSTLDVQPSPAAAPTSAIPIAQQVESLTPAEAKTRLSELSHDREWGARFIAAKPGSAEHNLFDALTRRAAEMPAASAAPDPVLDAPARAEDYKVEDLNGRRIAMDPESEKVVAGTLLPAAQRLGLSQIDVTSIAAAVQRPMTEEQCEGMLRRVWGKDFDRGLEDFQRAVTSAADRALLEQYPDTLGNNAPLILSVVAAFRRRQGRR